MLTPVHNDRYARLLKALRAMERVLVAFSGGADSTLLLHAAHEALGDSVLALTCATPYTPADEIKGAVVTAKNLGVSHGIVNMPILDALRSNPLDRCYLCKRFLFGRLVRRAEQAGIVHVVDGSNADDLDDHRPGRRAVQELGVVSPLLDAGMAKEDVRDISQWHGLATWDLPAGACLLTRLPHGTRVREAELARIDQGERILRSLGFATVRLRSHGEIARIEVPHDMVARIVQADRRFGIHARLRELGYRHVTLDLAGYRMGSLNRPDIKCLEND
ncbi:ATP-dependent sacrificial sulfur transferase LarE [Desulfoplanes sp.]